MSVGQSNRGTHNPSGTFLHLKLSTTDGMPVSQVPPRVEEIVQEHLSRIPKLIDDFVAGTIEIF